MSLMTTWTTSYVPPRRTDRLDQLRPRDPAVRPPWDCLNCSLQNPGARRRCTDCGTRRDQP